eukprot:g10557.t1
MAEGFAAADYVTDVRLSEVQGKRLWLVRVPRHIDPTRLEGAKVKLPARKGREGKVLGRVSKAGDSDDSDREEGHGRDEGLVVRAADAAESAGFRALFSAEEEGPLTAAGPFAGQLNVSVETADLEPVGVDSHAPMATFVEPYRGRPQLQGMRVRSKPAGAGSEYTPIRPLANHGHGRKRCGDHTPPATPDQDKGGKRNKHAASSGTAAHSQSQSPPAGTPMGSKKKKKRKSTGGGGAAVEGEQAQRASPMAKKSKKKKTEDGRTMDARPARQTADSAYATSRCCTAAKMVFTGKTTGFALLALGLAARRSAAVETCLDLISAVEAATGTATTVTLEADITCETHIEIAVSQEVVITSADTGPHTLTIGTLFAGATATEQTGAASLIINDGTLTINGVNFANEEGGDGNRAIYNTGTLTVVDSEFNLFHDGAFIDEGGAIFSDSSETVDITGCTFKSNVVLLHGGAMYVGGSETLTITGSTFSQNEVGTQELGTSSGGDLWTNRLVELTVEDSVFSGSAAEYGGAAIVCCGATIAGSNFSSTDVFSTSRHFGAVLVGGPDEDACPRALTITNSVFSGCSVDSALGEGGSLAVFDTTAELTTCTFEASVGTAILFESSSADGEHKLDMTSCQFNENTGPSEAYASSVPQGSAVVMTNTGVSDGDLVEMGTFFNMFCFANVPYECEFVYDGAEIVHEGEFKCHICDIDGTRQATGLDDDLLGATDRSVDSGSDDNQGIVIGLSLALGLTLVVIGALAVWKFRVRKNARRLMEDMGEGDL